MPDPTRRLRDVRSLLKMVLPLLVVGSSLAAGPNAGTGAGKPFDADQIRKDMARVRARLESRRAVNSGGKPASPQPGSARDGLKAEKSLKGRTDRRQRDRQAPTLAYRVALGQTFAYRVEIESEQFYKFERFAGSPVFTVKSIDPERGAQMFAIGKVSYFSRLRGSTEETEKPTRGFWLGSLIRLGPSGLAGGNGGSNESTLPTFFTELVDPTELIFPPLPRSITGRLHEKSSATLWRSNSIGGVAPGISIIDGTQTRTVESTPLSDSLVQVRTERSFTSKEARPLTWRYVATSRFDRGRGLLLDTSAQATEDSGGKPTSITIKIRLLEGEELNRAVDQANKDWVGHPAELEPLELARVPLDVKSLPRLKSATDTKPGMAVAHFRDDTLQWYLVDVLEVVSERTQEVKIRYRGSREVLVVPAGQLAIPPAGIGPAR